MTESESSSRPGIDREDNLTHVTQEDTPLYETLGFSREGWIITIASIAGTVWGYCGGLLVGVTL